MPNNSDSDETDQYQQYALKRPRLRRLRECVQPLSLNNLAKQLTSERTTQNGNTPKLTATSESGEIFKVVLPENQPNEISTSGPDIFKTILQNQSILFEMTNNVLDNQLKIMQNLDHLTARIDGFRSHNMNVSMEFGEESDNVSGIKQIKSIEDLDEMEDLLKDNVKKLQLMNAARFICSGGIGTAKTCAYRLVDVVFSREFLTKCSWAGGSRKEEPKTCLKGYKLTLKYFYETVKRWDSTYTIEENEYFFKTILKNALQRLNHLNLRLSTSRSKRKKNINLKKRVSDPDYVLEDSRLVSVLNNIADMTGREEVNVGEADSGENDEEHPEIEVSLC